MGRGLHRLSPKRTERFVANGVERLSQARWVQLLDI